MGVWTVSGPARRTILVLHDVYPLCLLLYFFVTFALGLCKLQRATEVQGAKNNRLKIVKGLSALIIVTFTCEAVVDFIEDLRPSHADTSADQNIYVFFSLVFWGIQFLALRGYELKIRHPFYVTWSVALLGEILLSILSLVDSLPTTATAYGRLGLHAVRISVLAALLGASLAAWRQKKKRKVPDDECRPLLPGADEVVGSQESGHQDSNGDASNYGTNGSKRKPDQSGDGVEAPADGSKGDENATQAQEKEKGDARKTGDWWAFVKRFRLLFRYIKFPRHSWLNLLGIGLCVLVGRALGILVPRQLGLVTDALASRNAVWVDVSMYLLYRWLQSTSIFQTIWQRCWDPIDRSIHQSIQTAAFEHSLSLSSDYHESKRFGESNRAINQGYTVTYLLQFALFELGPLVLDMIIAVGYLYHLFGAYMGLIAISMAIMYFWTSSTMDPILREKRKAYRDRAEEEFDILYEATTNWYTVLVFNRTGHEAQRYRAALRKQLSAHSIYYLWYSCSSAVQSVSLSAGLTAACFLAVWEVMQGTQPLGNFVILLSYWSAASSSFESIGSRMRRILEQMTEVERLIDLLETQPTVQDKQDAVPLQLREGHVGFEDVSFAYDPRQMTISHMNFEAKPGQKVALVGETGAGKSTILKLLLRLRDPSHGRIMIDGQHIHDVTIRSVREHVGVVSQNPKLFNESIMYNVRYGRLDATDEEVLAACKAVDIHEKILSFPDKYDTKVGESAVKLSGGELQRMSIARAILKNPKIIILDEATSMVDSVTERHIQDSLDALGKGRTTFVVAHRLSTIMNADLILVMKQGEIVEQGTHQELVSKKGAYHEFWSTQLLTTGSKESSEQQPSKGHSATADDMVTANDTLPGHDQAGTAEVVNAESKPSSSPEVSSKVGPAQDGSKVADESLLALEVEPPKGLSQPSNGSTAKEVTLKPTAAEFKPQEPVPGPGVDRHFTESELMGITLSGISSDADDSTAAPHGAQSMNVDGTATDDEQEAHNEVTRPERPAMQGLDSTSAPANNQPDRSAALRISSSSGNDTGDEGQAAKARKARKRRRQQKSKLQRKRKGTDSSTTSFDSGRDNASPLAEVSKTNESIAEELTPALVGNGSKDPKKQKAKKVHFDATEGESSTEHQASDGPGKASTTENVAPGIPSSSSGKDDTSSSSTHNPAAGDQHKPAQRFRNRSKRWRLRKQDKNKGSGSDKEVSNKPQATGNGSESARSPESA